MNSPEQKRILGDTSLSSGDDETVVMGLAFMKCSTSQRTTLNVASVSLASKDGI